MLVTRASSDNPTGPEDGSAADFYAQYIMKFATGETTYYAPSAPLPRLRYASRSEEAGGFGLLSYDQAGEFFGRRQYWPCMRPEECAVPFESITDIDDPDLDWMQILMQCEHGFNETPKFSDEQAASMLGIPFETYKGCGFGGFKKSSESSMEPPETESDAAPVTLKSCARRRRRRQRRTAACCRRRARSTAARRPRRRNS